MSRYMLLFCFFITYLYINLICAISVSRIKPKNAHQTSATNSGETIHRYPVSMITSSIQSRVIDAVDKLPVDVLSKDVEDIGNLMANQQQANRSQSNVFENTIDFSNGNQQVPHFNKATDIDAKENEVNEEAEMFTNNHQSINEKPNNHHSRHYNSYPQGSNYNKYIPPQASNNMFSNNYNLNYIHNLLTKPSSSSNLMSNLLNSNQNSLSYSASPYGLFPTYQNGYTSSLYHSASSSLSAVINNIQQGNNRPNIISMSNMIAPQQQQQQQQDQPNSTSVAIDSPASACGRQQSGYREPRIVGGNSSYEGEFPWAVSIQRHGNHHCGGVIVGRKWILTAAHCVRSQSAANLVVRTGGHTLTRSSNSINSHLERDYLVDQIVMHDDFSRYDNLTASQMKSSANTNNADIALLKLKHEIHWNELAWPVCLPNRDAGNFSGHDAIVIGWGKLSEKSDDFSNELQKVKLTIIDNKVCQNWFRQAGREMPIDDRIICAGFKNGGKDACHGDSGGPLLSRINGQYVVVGVVSTGIGCARPLLPGLYSRVPSYISWIERYVT